MLDENFCFNEVIRYNSTPKFSDIAIDLPLSDYILHDAIPEWNISIQSTNFSYKPFSRIFCKTDYLRDFIEFFSNITVPCHLISGVSDLNPLKFVGVEKILKNKNIISWVGTNLPKVHPKILTIPIGLQERSRGDYQSKFLKIHNKINKIIFTYHSDTSTLRVDSELLKDLEDHEIVQKESKLPRCEYLNLLGKYKYSLCLPGNGLDTHRIYESIAMGAIPIVFDGPLCSLYEEMGCIAIKSLCDLGQLNKLPFASGKQGIYQEKLMERYWALRIQKFQVNLENN